ncbi:Zinc finger protein CONSTANS-LIKE 2 [Acorus calamus]|uniref:Zinc finger protein CONSTANS-LIKE 2 n=1 Tax=Acorus calamus TaxID=4465 RepID=A0AAV9FA38_ACOCL|nr:Zinc finger protein CONSTANS-LIKE 2 [Acorus calamus]
MKARVCELCDCEASLYCDSDSAYLCFGCDAAVHGANFLVSRHLRRPICSSCGSLDRRIISGPGHRPFRPICRSCDDSTSSTSSSCISSAESASTEKIRGRRPRPRRRRGWDEKAEGILVNWCARMGAERRRLVVAEALEAMEAQRLRRVSDLPFRVCLASCLWRAMKARGMGDARRLARLEACSGVPARVVALGEARLARARAREAEEEEEEGWAECT